MSVIITGAVKVKDGLFVGDAFAANDIEFVAANKVSRIVNCAAREVPNHFESVGVEYLSYVWMDNDAQVILDIRNTVVQAVASFIDAALEKGESVLVHSFKGQSRSVTILTAYLMKKFRWKLNKCLQFMQSRRSDVAIKPAFHRQLVSFERRVALQCDLSSTWDSPPSDTNCMEELIMFNTFLNSQANSGVKSFISETLMKTKSCGTKKLAWRDNHSDNRAQLERDSDSSGKIHSFLHVKPILKKSKQLLIPSSVTASPVSTAPSTPVPTFSLNNGPVRVGRTSLNTQLGAIFPLRTPLTNHHVRPPSPMVSRSASTPNVAPRRPLMSSSLRSPSPSLMSSSIRQPSPSILSSSIRQASPSPLLSSSSRQSSSMIRPPSPARRDMLVRPDFLLPKTRPNLLAGQIRRAPSPMTAALQGPLRPISAPLWRPR